MQSSVADAAASYMALTTSMMSMSADIVTSFMSGFAKPVAGPAPEPVEARVPAPLRTRSWYRQPDLDPFGLTAWTRMWQPSSDPFGWKGGMMSAWTPGVVAPVLPVVPLETWALAFPAYWNVLPTSSFLPATGLTNYPAAIFSAYRSDGGHAVAQIMIDTMTTAAKVSSALAPTPRWH